jgi:polysaccharide biosynthesis protein PslA
MALFAVLFGIRHIDGTEHQDGLMLAPWAPVVLTREKQIFAAFTQFFSGNYRPLCPQGLGIVSVTAFIGDGLARPVSLAGRRISLQHTVATFLLIELTLFFLCSIAPSFYLEKFGFLIFTPEQFEAQLAAAAVGAVIYLSAARLYPVYAAAHILDTRLNLKRLTLVLFATFAGLVAIAAATKSTQHYSRLWFFSWAASATDMILFARLCALMCINGRLQRGACIYRALSLGLGAPALTAEQLLRSTGYRSRAVKRQALSSTADLDNLADTIRTHEIDQVYISVPWAATPELAGKISKLRDLAVDVFLYCNDERLRGELLDVVELGDGLAFQAGFCPIAGWDYWIKRCGDIVICLVALTAVSPFLLITAGHQAGEPRAGVLSSDTRGAQRYSFPDSEIQINVRRPGGSLRLTSDKQG